MASFTLKWQKQVVGTKPKELQCVEFPQVPKTLQGNFHMVLFLILAKDLQDIMVHSFMVW